LPGAERQQLCLTIANYRGRAIDIGKPGKRDMVMIACAKREWHPYPSEGREPFLAQVVDLAAFVGPEHIQEVASD
jgi:hypothetical protein